MEQSIERCWNGPTIPAGAAQTGARGGRTFGRCPGGQPQVSSRPLRCDVSAQITHTSSAITMIDHTG